MKKLLNKNLYTLKDLAEALGVPYSTLNKHFKDGVIKIETISFGRREYLTEETFNDIVKSIL